MKFFSRFGLAALLILTLMTLTACSFTMMADNTGLVVNEWVNQGLFSGGPYYQDAKIVTDGVENNKPYIVLQFTNTSTNYVYDLKFKRSGSSTESANWLNSGDHASPKMFVGDKLSIYCEGSLVGTYELTNGHYVPADKRFPVSLTVETTQVIEK